MVVASLVAAVLVFGSVLLLEEVPTLLLLLAQVRYRLYVCSTLSTVTERHRDNAVSTVGAGAVQEGGVLRLLRGGRTTEQVTSVTP